MIISEPRLEGVGKKCRESGKKVVFASGVFDLFHIGHLKYLQAARSQGDVLVVWVNSNESVKHLHKTHFMIFGFKERARLINALSVVDYVVKFKDKSPYRILRKFEPDVVARSGKPHSKSLVDKTVQKYGGAMFFCPIVKDLSTTKIIELIKKKN